VTRKIFSASAENIYLVIPEIAQQLSGILQPTVIPGSTKHLITRIAYSASAENIYLVIPESAERLPTLRTAGISQLTVISGSSQAPPSDSFFRISGKYLPCHPGKREALTDASDRRDLASPL